MAKNKEMKEVKEMSAAEKLRQKILNNIAREGKATIGGADVLLREPTQKAIREFANSAPAGFTFDPSTVLFLLSVRDPETKEALFTAEDADTVNELTASFIQEFQTEFERVFGVSNEEIAGNSTGIEAV